MSSFALAIEKRALSNYFATIKEENGITTVSSGKTNKACAGTQDTVSPCSSCAGAAPIAASSTLSCSDYEVYGSLKFSITLRSSQASAYLSPYCSTLLVGVPEAPNQKVVVPTHGQTTYTTTGTTGIANQDVTATFNWSDICSNSGGDTACAKSFKSKWAFGFVKSCGQSAYLDTDFNDGVYRVEFRHRYAAQSLPMTMNANNPCFGDTANSWEGFCHYQIFPGDEKAYVRLARSNNASGYVVGSIETDGAAMLANDASAIKYKALRVYYTEGANAFGNITLNSPKKDLSTDGVNLSDTRIERGLVNGTTYSFVAANVDEAGIVTHFALEGQNTTVGQNVVLNPVDDGNGQGATPAPVYGLLDGKNCFVATAAYGSDMAPQVEMLRTFRGRYLLNNSIGKAFVEFYYKHSPAFADWIAESDFRRAVARLVLQPFVFLAGLTMALGLGASAGFLAFVFGVLGLGVAFAGSLALVMVWGRRWLLRAR